VYAGSTAVRLDGNGGGVEHAAPTVPIVCIIVTSEIGDPTTSNNRASASTALFLADFLFNYLSL